MNNMSRHNINDNINLSLVPFMSDADIFVVVLLVLMVLMTTTTVCLFAALLRRVSQSVGTAPPTAEMLTCEQPSQSCPLFRHVPQLAPTLAWRSLGVTGATPVHICQIPALQRDNNDSRTLSFWIIREDLIHPDYGGNKVRTLQHQLAVCQAKREAGQVAYRQLVAIGSGGSNQVVATAVHAKALGWDNSTTTTSNKAAVNVSWIDRDQPDFDNTLNMLSVLSFSHLGWRFNWGQSKGWWSKWRTLYGAWTQRDYIPMMLGGNCAVGVLGQASGVLELAEQIMAGESPNVSRIYVPVGSGCTVSGLVVGLVLCQHLGLPVLQNVQIFACNVHPNVALYDRWFQFHVNPRLTFMPMTISHSVNSACVALRELGGPDLQQASRQFIKTNVQLRADQAVVGKYGAHSQLSRQAAQHYDAKGFVSDYVSGRPTRPLWVCGHFVAKALQPLLTKRYNTCYG